MLLGFAYLLIEWHITPLILFPANNNMSMFVNCSNSTLVFFEAACQANTGTERNLAESSW